MRAKEKQARTFQRTVKKIVRFFVFSCLAIIAAAWLIMNYVSVAKIFNRFFVIPIETKEIDTYYDLLSDTQPPGKSLVVNLNLKDSDDIRVAMKKMQNVMGLGDYSIDLAYHDKEKPPGYINIESNTTFDVTRNKMTIYLSKKLKSQREQITVLAHELGHIYVWALPKYTFGPLDQEKLVDTSCMYLGLGALYLNGMSDEFNMTPEGGYQTSQKNFGYLTPQQFGYLLARFCKDHNIKDAELKPHLNDAGWKYYKSGAAYFDQQSHGVSVPDFILEAQSYIRKFMRFFEAKISEGLAQLGQFLKTSRTSSS